MKKLLIIGTLLSLSAMLFASGEITVSSGSGSSSGAGHVYGNSDGLLYMQVGDTIGASNHACQLDSAYPFEADEADDITPTGAGWEIDSVTTWWANWNGFTTWANVPNIHFLVYLDSSGQPADSAVIDLVVEQANYTATAYAADRWRVDMELPSTVSLLSGATYWIEVKPSNVFSVNGQTGWVGDNTLGGAEGWFRSALLGYPQWVTNTSVFSNPDEMFFALYGNQIVTGYWWDFEDGWQDWVHSNGAAFPAGWGVVSSTYNTAPPPSPGDSIFCIDSDAAGGGLEDTVFSPHFVRAGDWLFWGISFQDYAGRDTVEVLVRERLGGGVWGPWSMVFQYTSDTDPTTDSADVSGFGDTLQVAFWYWAGAWDWFAAFDNVGPWLDTFTLAVEETPVEMPQVFNYRMLSTNPIANNAVIEFALPVNGTVNFTVYDVTGRTVLIQNHGVLNAGVHSLTWNRNDNSGNQVAAGSYFFRLEAAGNVATGKFVVTE